MTSTAAIDVATVPAIDHVEGVRLGEIAYDRLTSMFEGLGPEDWAKATDCTGWTVRHLAGHMVGAMRAAASVRELASQQREVRRRVKRGVGEGGDEVDVLTALQIERAAALSPAEVVAELRRLVGPAARGRRRIPGLARRKVRFPVEAGTISDEWSLGYLVDVILTRDAWLHRVDLSRAVGAEMELTADHDGRIIADVVAEWARRHGQPFRLTLTGPAGGTYVAGAGGEEIEIDPVAFCRAISRRTEGEGLLTQEVPF